MCNIAINWCTSCIFLHLVLQCTESTAILMYTIKQRTQLLAFNARTDSGGTISGDKRPATAAEICLYWRWRSQRAEICRHTGKTSWYSHHYVLSPS